MTVLQRVRTHLSIIYGGIAWHIKPIKCISSATNAHTFAHVFTHSHKNTLTRIQTTRVYSSSWSREWKRRAKRIKWYDAYPQKLTVKRIFSLIILSLIHNSSTNGPISWYVNSQERMCFYALVQYVCRACNVPGKMTFFSYLLRCRLPLNLWALNSTTSIHSSATM